MKKLLLLSFLLLSINAFGQDFNRFLIGVNFSADYNYRMLREVGEGINHTGMHTTTLREFINMRNDREVGKISFTKGISAIYNFSEVFGIELGARYSRRGFQTEWEDVNWTDPAVSPAPINRARNIYRYEYLDIPLKANFTFGNGRLRGVATAGFAANFLLRTNSTMILKLDDGSKVIHSHRRTGNSIQNYNIFNISPIIGAGIEYRISNRVVLRAIPEFSFGLRSLNEYTSGGISEHLWNAGLNIGLFYGF